MPYGRLLREKVGSMLFKWAGGSAPTLTTTAGKYDIVAFTRIASGEYLGFVAQNF